MIKKLLLTLLLLSVAIRPMQATGQRSDEEQNHTTTTTTTITTTTSLIIVPEAEVTKESNLGHFAWGADLGSAIDLTANDMTALGLHAYFGYKGEWVKFAGIGAGINTLMTNSTRCYPIYTMFRTSFSRQPKLCFLDMRLGISINSILDNTSKADLFGSIGLGITLAKGKKFSSHIIISYNYMPIRSITTYIEVPVTDMQGEVFEGESIPTEVVAQKLSFPDIHYAAIRIGCSF